MNIVKKNFGQIAAKYTPKRIKLHPFLKFSQGSMRHAP